SLGRVLHAADGPALPIVKDVEPQPLAAQVMRVVTALESLGSPLREADRKALDASLSQVDAEKVVPGIPKVLDPYCLLGIELRPDMRWTTRAGEARRQLVEQGWSHFLVKVHNSAHLTGVLRATSPNALRLAGSPAADVKNRWLELQMFEKQPLIVRLG